ncbi:MAG: DUF3841 domain-containing protein [Marinisporobacter sp.]|nr:DUF3841 domain-containing protein [Marinisporobacter sp.]
MHMIKNPNKSNEKIRLWTRQHKNVWQELKEKEIYRAKKEHIIEKNDTISEYYLKLYDWYIKHAQRFVPKPEGVTYPIWFSTSEEKRLQLVENTVVLELEVDRKDVVITDFDKWGYVVNYWYVPIDQQDEKKHNEELKRYGIGDESALIMGDKGNFYPLLKNKILKSWERMFYISNEETCFTQATLWEMKKEWVVNVLQG